MVGGRARRVGLVLLFLLATVGIVRESPGGAVPVCPDSDSNNSLATAEALVGIVEDRSLCGSLGERDWFSIAVDAGDLVAVDLFVESGPGELDIVLTDADEVELDTAATSESVESIRYEADEAATLYVEVFERGNDVDGEYSLAGSARPAGACGTDEDALEPNDVRAEATPIDGEAPIAAWICDNPDVFEVNVPSSSPVDLEVTMTADASAGDLDLAVYDSTGTQLDTSTGVTPQEQVTVPTPVTAGRYFVEVFGYQGASGGYDLEVSGAGPLVVLTGSVTTWDPVTYREVPAEATAVDVYDATTEVASAVADEAGAFGFSFDELADGTYTLELSGPGSPAVWATEWYQNADAQGDADDVVVASELNELDPVLLQLVPVDDPYTDTPAWAEYAVIYTATYQLLSGILEGGQLKFKPNDSITRGQMARLAYRAAGSPEPCSSTHTHGLSDVPAWVEDAVTWITCDDTAELPIMAGYVDGTFKPNDPITRAQTARLVYRLAGSLQATLPGHPFTDVPAWAAEAVDWVSWDPDGAGTDYRPLMTGYQGNLFKPSDPINRGQVANLIWNVARSSPHWAGPGGSVFWQDSATIPGSVLFR